VGGLQDLRVVVDVQAGLAALGDVDEVVLDAVDLAGGDLRARELALFSR